MHHTQAVLGLRSLRIVTIVSAKDIKGFRSFSSTRPSSDFFRLTNSKQDLYHLVFESQFQSFPRHGAKRRELSFGDFSISEDILECLFVALFVQATFDRTPFSHQRLLPLFQACLLLFGQDSNSLVYSATPPNQHQAFQIALVANRSRLPQNSQTDERHFRVCRLIPCIPPSNRR